MPIVFSGTEKIISLPTGTSSLSIKELYSRWVDWVVLEDNMKYLQAMRYVGGDPLPGSKELGITYFMLNGWKIRPAEENHTIDLNGNLYSEDGSSPFTPCLGSFNVTLINTVSNLVDSTVQQLPEIEYSSYNGGVTLDPVNGTDSILYPYGTPRFPCKTVANSYAIRQARGFNKIYLLGDVTLANMPDGVIDNLDIIGATGFRQHTLTITNTLVTNCVAQNINVTGTCKVGSVGKVIDCNVYNLLNADLTAYKSYLTSGTYTNTDLYDCVLEGDINIQAGGNLSGIGIVFEGDFTTIDMQGQVSVVSMDIGSGIMTLMNAVAGCLAEFNMQGGEMVLDASCTGGDFYAEGFGTLYNESTMTIKDNHLLALETIPEPIMRYTRS